jgi:hypothetical protein
MLLPYSHRVPPRAPCALDRWLGPGWRLVERHEVATVAPPARALEALARLRLREMPAVRALFALRRLRADPDQTLREFFSTTPFVLLDEVPGAELVGGVLLPSGKRRRGSARRHQPRSPAEFEAALATAPFAAIATFRAEPRERARAVLWTETWVRTRGATPSALFSAYWLAIGPFSAWIRRIFLREARRRAEASSGAPRAMAQR